MSNPHTLFTPVAPSPHISPKVASPAASPRRAPSLKASLLTALLAAATTASAQDAPARPAAGSSWLDGVRAQCVEQYSVEQCEDHDFLNENFHVDSLQTAHRTAVQRNGDEQRALRELLLQRACNNRKAYCAQNAAQGCAEQLAQMCTAIAEQAAACLKQARQYCDTFPQNGDCLAQRQLQCPSAKRQPVDKLLAKYPRLSDQQQEHVRLIAQQMDKNLGRDWVGALFRLLGF